MPKKWEGEFRKTVVSFRALRSSWGPSNFLLHIFCQPFPAGPDQDPVVADQRVPRVEQNTRLRSHILSFLEFSIISVANIRCDYMQWKEIATTSHFILLSFHFPFPLSTLQLVKPDAVKCMSAPSPITISLRHPAHCTVDGDNHRFVFHSSALSIPLFYSVVFQCILSGVEISIWSARSSCHCLHLDCPHMLLFSPGIW